MDLTGDRWLLVQPHIPPPSPAAGRGRPLINERAVLNGILWKFRHNAAWYDIPDRFPSFQTCYRRYRLWRRRGVMQAILRTFYRDMRDRGGLYLENAFQDDTIVISSHGNQLKFQVDPQVQDTWQLSISSPRYLPILLTPASGRTQGETSRHHRVFRSSADLNHAIEWVQDGLVVIES